MKKLSCKMLSYVAGSALWPEIMRIAIHLRLAVLILTLSVASCCFPQKPHANYEESANNFVHRVYARYGANGNPANLFEGSASKVFHPSLIALARSDAKASGPDAGVLDYDPVCNCQDWGNGGILDLKIAIKSVDATHATAIVTFSGNDDQPNKVVLTLLREKGHWLIFNIEDLSGPGPHKDLRTMLKANIQELSSKQKSPTTQR